MKRLYAALTPFVDGVELGDAQRRFPAEQVTQALQGVRKGNERYFMLCVFMIVDLFAAIVWLTLTHLQDPAVIKIVFAVFGVSAIGLVRMMHKLWQEKVTTDLLLTLVGVLEEDVARSVVAVLLKRLR